MEIICLFLQLRWKKSVTNTTTIIRANKHAAYVGFHVLTAVVMKSSVFWDNAA
jgi:hypothetical protein